MTQKEERYIPFTEDQSTHKPTDSELMGILHERFWSAIQENRIPKVPYRPAIRYRWESGYFDLVCTKTNGEIINEVKSISLGHRTEVELEIFRGWCAEAINEEIAFSQEESAKEEEASHLGVVVWLCSAFAIAIAVIGLLAGLKQYGII